MNEEGSADHLPWYNYLVPAKTRCTMTINLHRLDQDFHFQATNEQGLSMHFDGGAAIGGHDLGFRPMQSVLAAVGACSSIDIILLLRKQRQELKDLRIKLASAVHQDSRPLRTSWRYRREEGRASLPSQYGKDVFGKPDAEGGWSRDHLEPGGGSGLSWLLLCTRSVSALSTCGRAKAVEKIVQSGCCFRKK